MHDFLATLDHFFYSLNYWDDFNNHTFLLLSVIKEGESLC